MTVEVVAPGDLGPGDLSRWSALQAGAADLGSPFLGPDFAVACARARPRTRVAVVTTGEGTGFLPFEPGRAGVARALGQGFADVQGLVAPAAADVDVRALLSACGLRRWEFDHLLASQAPRFARAPHRWVQESSPVVDVGGGWAAYDRAQREASNSLLQSTARKRRKLERDHGPVTLAFHEPDHALLDRLLTWKSEQYRRTGWRDLFADPGMRHLVHDLLDTREPGLAAPLTVLRAGDEVVGLHLGLRSSTTLAWWFPAYAPRFGAYSPGLVLVLDLLRAMGDQGLRSLDLGKGDEAYKRRLANSCIPLLRGAVSRDVATARLDAVRRWPGERARSFVLGNPRVRGWARSARVRAAVLRSRASTRVVEARGSGGPRTAGAPEPEESSRA